MKKKDKKVTVYNPPANSYVGGIDPYNSNNSSLGAVFIYKRNTDEKET
jgi:hypothetical protein